MSGSPLRTALAAEAAMYVQLGRWVARRPDVPAAATAVPYGRLAAPMVWLFVFGSVLEVVALDLLLSRWWTPLRVPALVVGVWGVVWMLGLAACYRMRPHVLTDDAIHVRAMSRTEVVVPVRAIAEVRVADRDESGVRSVRQVDDDLLVLVSGRTNLQLDLVPGTRLATPLGELAPASVGLWVDEPREVAGRIRRLRSGPAPR